MKTTDYSITKNGLSVCRTGEEKYTAFHPAHRPNDVFYQLDYRHKDNDSFSTVAPTLEQCREKRDKWVRAKNHNRLYPSILKKIQDGKRLTKSEMGYQIGQVDTFHVMSISWDSFLREDIVLTFNKIFGTEIK